MLNGILKQEKNGIWLARVYLHSYCVHIEGRSKSSIGALFYAARAVNRIIGEKDELGSQVSNVKFHLIERNDNV
jgi:hypothetical protein